MITTEKRKLGDIPILIVYKDSIEKATQNGTILLFHGLGSSKDEQSDELERLAYGGFLAVGVDVVGHGERRYSDFESRFFADSPGMDQEFVQAVWETAKEVPSMIDALTQARLIRDQKVGIVGISLGGHIAYTSITQDSRVKVAVSIIGAPQWKLDLPESPHRHLDQFSAIKLMSQNAGQDEVVSTEYAKDFHRRLREKYDDYDERFAYVEYPESGHFMRERDWQICWDRTIAWFEQHLTQQFQIQS